MRLPKRNLPTLGCALLGGLLIFGVARSLHSAAPLDRAQAIANTALWQSEVGNSFGSPIYFWSGQTELTYLRTGHDGTTHVFRRSGAPGTQGDGVECPEVHLRGGYPGQLSPDGRWFVEWHQNKQRQHQPTFLALDGTGRKIVGQPTWGGEGVWTPDGAAMVSATWRSGTGLDRYDPVTGAMQQTVVTGLTQFFSPQRIDAQGRLIGFQEDAFILNFARFGTGKTAQMPASNYPNLKVVRVDPMHPTTAPEQWTAPVPGDVDIGTCLVSPSGDRVLWVLHGDTTPDLLRRLRRYIPGQAAKSAVGYRWMVSGLHGEDMHEVASYRFEPTQQMRGSREPYSRPRWLPDSKHISFIFRNTLYVRPVD